MANLAPDDSRNLKSPLAPSCRDVELAGVESEAGPTNTRPERPEAAEWRRKNIRANIAFQTMMSLSWGMAMGPVFDKYLFLLGSGMGRGPQIVPKMHANSLVGVAESISGITSLIMAIPVGYVVDRQPDKRARLCRWSSCLGLLAVFSGFIAVLTDELLMIMVMLVSFGAFMELSFSASEAIFADSIPAGERSSYFVTKSVMNTIGSACGPGVSAIGLAVVGDQWHSYQIKFVIIVGLLFFFCRLVFHFSFSEIQMRLQHQRKPRLLSQHLPRLPRNPVKRDRRVLAPGVQKFAAFCVSAASMCPSSLRWLTSSHASAQE
mmetsp:Transcript_67390/g.158796  ORF Transcript_67390/g.158796 Transcript_67390/m.158796 type:complete len:320 (-) Transcript_67390:612-1571(-)